MVAVLFVCLGNICRSPAGEGILLDMLNSDPTLENLYVESCGLGNWHVGQSADPRMRLAAKNRGVHLNRKGRQFQHAYFDQFDYILAADHEILDALQQRAKNPVHRAKIYLMTAFSSTYHNQEVPDPYYGGDAGFDHVLDMLEDSCHGLLEHIKKNHDL